MRRQGQCETVRPQKKQRQGTTGGAVEDVRNFRTEYEKGRWVG